MKTSPPIRIVFFLLLSALPSRAQNLKQCSTEKVNHEDCAVFIDRRYPLTLPTIQMSPGKKLLVVIQDPLVFETLTLDETGATALPGTDQGAALLTAAIPDLKGLIWSNVTYPPAPTFQPPAQAPGEPDPCTPAAYDAAKCEQETRFTTLKNIFQILTAMEDSAQKSIPDSKSELLAHIQVVYSQLNQIMAPIPKPGSRSDSAFAPPQNAAGTPNPWTDYRGWRLWVLCELVGGTIDNVDCMMDPGIDPSHPTYPTFNNILGEISKQQGRLPSTPPAPPPDDPFFDQSTFAALVKQAKGEIDRLTDPAAKKNSNDTLNSIQKRANNLNSILAALGSTLTNVQKDFLTYYQNIYLATTTPPQWKRDQDGKLLANQPIGWINDPKLSNVKYIVAYSRLFGRQVVYAINAVNNISTPVDSVTAASAKLAITTITVLYADPLFETSAGVIFSNAHNRTFSNQTVTSPPPGSTVTPGDILIYENKTSPEVVPIVAAHVRIFHDFDPGWLGHRRSAIYATAFVGLNPYSVAPEYGAGPTFSWRSFMFSFLYDRTHESALTQGLSDGQIVCSPSSAIGASPPPCTPAPPAPTTLTKGVNAFAIGLTIRIPTSFAAGTGGVSR